AEGNPVWSIYETDDGEALPAGTYTVTETGGELFDRDGVEYERTTTYQVGEEVTAEAAELEVTASGTAKAVVTNAYESPKGVAKIRVAKAFEGDYQGDERFEFVLADEDGNEVGRAKAANGETAEFAPIRYKAEDADGEFAYTITEVVPDEPTAGIIYNTDPVEVTVTLDENLNASVAYGEDEEADHATVTNRLEAPEAEAGTITVRKVVSSTRAEDKQKDFGFRVTLLESDNKTTRKLSGTYGDMEFTDGVAEFTLRDGESRTARDLPFDEAGKINYSCEETDAKGLTPSLKEQKNAAGNGTTITCTNTYKETEKRTTTTTTRPVTTTTTRTSTPKTGDPTTYLPLAALAVAGAVALAIGARRRRE
ncbi:MAG: LPXTG cell wall anchor domain-containing protein, partial [Atopobiaceae bacterium]|nr:LPXTG cell wall anchor domain-containing protein [Atopobiaceae bacterium]